MEWIKKKGNMLLENAKLCLKAASQVLKKPMAETVRMIEVENGKDGLRFILGKGIVISLFILFLAIYLDSKLEGTLHYEGIIVFALLFTIGVDVIEAYLLKIFTTAAKGATTMQAMYTVVGIRGIYDVVIVLVTFVLCLISGILGCCVCVLLMLFLPCVEYASYRASIHADENMKAYVFMIVKICMLILWCLLFYFVGWSILDSPVC